MSFSKQCCLKADQTHSNNFFYESFTSSNLMHIANLKLCENFISKTLSEVPSSKSINNSFKHADLLSPPLSSHCSPMLAQVVFTLQSIRHSRPSWTMRSPGACRKWGRKWRSWMLSFSSPLSLDLDLGLTERERGKHTVFGINGFF